MVERVREVATKMTTQRNIVIGIESLTKFNFGQTLPELEFYVDAVNYVDLIVQPSFGNQHDTWILPNKILSGISSDWSHSGTSGCLVTDKKLPEVLTNVEVLNDEFEVDGDQLGWYFDPTATPSGNYDVAVVNGSMTVEGEQDDHIRKNVFFADGQSYDIAINVLNYSGSIILNFTSENGGLTSWQMVNSTGIINVNNLIGDGTNAYIDFSFLGTASIELDYITITSDEEMIYHADVSSANDYYAFGMQMPERVYQSDLYLYKFNGAESDDELKDVGNSLNFGARMYDSRLGRWMSRDPYEYSYPNISPYSFGLNNPLYFKDEDGNWIVDVDGNPIYTVQDGHVEHEIDGLILIGEIRHYYTNDGTAIIAYYYGAAIKVENAVRIEGELDFENSPRQDVPTDLKYDCHGHTCFPGQDIYIPGMASEKETNADEIFFNKSEYEYIPSRKAKAGDVKLIGPLDPRKINHSATRDEDGTYTTKDDRKPLRKGVTVKEMVEQWEGEAHYGVYRHKGNVSGGVTSDNGRVTEEVAKTAIENTNQ